MKKTKVPTIDPQLLYKVNDSVPALIAVYNLQTGQYIYVNGSVDKVLGYTKEDFLNGGIQFVNNLMHPDDLITISKQNSNAIKKANNNRREELNQFETFEYRLKHKDGKYRWIHTNGIVYSRDKNGNIEYVINISVDITARKNKEDEQQRIRDLAEKERNIFYNEQLKAASLSADISTILRKDSRLQDLFVNCLKSIVDHINAVTATIWFYNSIDKTVEIKSTYGHMPPKGTYVPKVRIGDFGVGKVAKYNTIFISNNVFDPKLKLIQNIDWAKKWKLKSFAGFPLFFKDTLIGVLVVFSSHLVTDSIKQSLASVADILAQEITRKELENKLLENQHRYQAFMTQSSEGIWRFELEKQIPIRLPAEKQIHMMYKYAFLAECNYALANMYGYKNPEDIVGARLNKFLIEGDPINTFYLKSFISSGYNLSGTESVEIDNKGNQKYFSNSLVGIIENGYLVRAWGIQQDITERKKNEDQILRLSQQKDEFIAIASHELKTPVTTLKAFTQILEKRFESKNEPEVLLFLNRMSSQISKLTNLISDLLDVSKIEAGKIQFNFSNFELNSLLQEVTDEMQRTTLKHKLYLRLDKQVHLWADRDRIGQVIINLISNAIKYSPDSQVILIKSVVNRDQVTISVKDTGIGIAKEEQNKVFERFFRANASGKEGFSGLGMGLYISSEIVKRHDGKIRVKSKKGLGSTFSVTLPLKRNNLVL